MFFSLLISCASSTGSVVLENRSTNEPETVLQDPVEQTSETTEDDCIPTQEICDGIDNDCDGLIDDEDDSLDLGSASAYALDLDNDGFGNSDEVIYACVAPEQYVEQADDCNDEDASIHPQAQEECDGIDNDCDEQIDSQEVCPCDFFTVDSQSYFFCTVPEDWSSAHDICSDYGYDLVNIHSYEELLNIGDNLSVVASIWLGLNDIEEEGEWVWSNGEEHNYVNWTMNEPNQFWSDEYDCAYITPYGEWGTSQCDYLSAYMCESAQ